MNVKRLELTLNLEPLTFNFRDEMKMQLREILIVAAVDDQPIGREMKFLYQALNGGIQVAEKFSIPGIKLLERSDSFLRDKQYVEWV